MAKHRDECFSDRGLHSVTSCLIKEASSGYSLNQPEWIITHEVILLGNLGEQDGRCPPGCFSKRGDLLKRHCIDEQRGELLFLFGSQSMLRTGNANNRHSWFPFLRVALQIWRDTGYGKETAHLLLNTLTCWWPSRFLGEILRGRRFW